MSVIYGPRTSYDLDAADYFARIVAVGSSISTDNKAAVNTFIVGCKADGIWNAIKASCILAGADTLAGALVPLVGVVPTNVNFLESDYSRTTGLKGNGLTKYLISNRNNNADPQDSQHIGVYVTALGTVTGDRYWLAVGGGVSGSTALYKNVGSLLTRSRSSTTSTVTNTVTSTGFFGISRSSSASYTMIANSTSTSITVTSQAPVLGDFWLYVRNPSAGLSDDRVSFYSIGESLNLALLNTRLATLMSSLI